MERLNDYRTRMVALALAAVVFAAIVPTLSLVEFSNGAEGLNVATALEIRRTGRWLQPTLNDEPRIAKPPLTGWITAAAIWPGTLERIDKPNPAIRHKAFESLALQVRLPALLAACIMLVGIFELGRILMDARTGMAALLIAASCLLWLRFSRYATSDIYLAMWVTLANVGIAKAIMDRTWARGCLLAGVALGAGLMTKGPVCLVQTLVPALIFVIWRSVDNLRHPLDQSPPVEPRWSAITLGLIVMLVIAVPWFAYVAMRNPMALSIWFTEVTREGATDQEPDRWYSYFSLIAYMAPWIAFFIAGLGLGFRHFTRREADGIIFALSALVWPILIMAFFRDRQIRYLLPMLGPACVLTAAAFQQWRMAPARDWGIRILGVSHWLVLAALGVAFPLAASGWSTQIQTVEATPWYSQELGMYMAAAGAAIIVISIVLQRFWSGAMMTATIVIMLALQALFIYGYRNSMRGRADLRPLADAIMQRAPGATVYSAPPHTKRVRPELLIYLNRTIRHVSDASTIHPQNGDQVLLMFQPERFPEPAPPEGWTHLSKSRRGHDWWHAFVRSGGSK